MSFDALWKAAQSIYTLWEVSTEVCEGNWEQSAGWDRPPVGS